MTAVYTRLVLTMMIWGGTFVFAKTAGSAIGELEAAAWRFLVSALLLTPLLLKGNLPRAGKLDYLGFVVLGLSGIYLYNLCFFYGLQAIESGHAGLIIALNPVVVMLFSALFLKEHLNRKMVIGILLSMVGAMLVVTGREQGAPGAETALTGVLLIFGCVLSWAVYSLVGKPMMKRYSPGQLIAISVWVGATMLLSHLYIAGGELPAIRGRPLFDVLYLAVLGTVLSFVWFYDAIDKLGASLASQFVNLVPVSAVGFGYLMLGERLSPLMLVGGLLVICGVLYTQRNREQGPNQAEA